MAFSMRKQEFSWLMYMCLRAYEKNLREWICKMKFNINNFNLTINFKQLSIEWCIWRLQIVMALHVSFSPSWDLGSLMTHISCPHHVSEPESCRHTNCFFGKYVLDVTLVFNRWILYYILECNDQIVEKFVLIGCNAYEVTPGERFNGIYDLLSATLTFFSIEMNPLRKRAWR